MSLIYVSGSWDGLGLLKNAAPPPSRHHQAALLICTYLLYLSLPFRIVLKQNCGIWIRAHNLAFLIILPFAYPVSGYRIWQMDIRLSKRPDIGKLNDLISGIRPLDCIQISGKISMRCIPKKVHIQVIRDTKIANVFHVLFASFKNQDTISSRNKIYLTLFLTLKKKLHFTRSNLEILHSHKLNLCRIQMHSK